jgi:lipopolysaccharide transport system ATP-binding protein
VRSDLAVGIEGISKRYRLGQLETALGLSRRLISRNDNRLVTWALRDVSFEVPEGRTMAIVGANGAGKSTLLKILARITEPTEGFADVRGRVGALLEVGTGFHPELTGRENVFLNGSILGMTRTEVRRKFDDIVDFAGTSKFIDTPVKRFSSGMYVRLAFAVAAFLEPEILIVDEVLAVGDAEFQKRCLGRMSEVAQDGRTVLFVSHNMQAVRRLCTDAVLLEQGRLIERGDTETVVRRYLASVDSPEDGQRAWVDPDQRPGDHRVRVVSVRATNRAGEPSSTFLSSEPIFVTIEFDLARLDSALTIGFDVAAYDASTVFRAMQTDAAEDVRPTMHEGRNAITCEIPAELLNSGRYFVNLRVAFQGVGWVARPDQVLQFDVVADHGESLFLNTGDRPGVIAPILAWGEAEPQETSLAASSWSAPERHR